MCRLKRSSRQRAGIINPFFHVQKGGSNPLGLVLQDHGNTQRNNHADRLQSIGSKEENAIGRELAQAKAEHFKRGESRGELHI